MQTSWRPATKTQTICCTTAGRQQQSDRPIDPLDVYWQGGGRRSAAGPVGAPQQRPLWAETLCSSRLACPSDGGSAACCGGQPTRELRSGDVLGCEWRCQPRPAICRHRRHRAAGSAAAPFRAARRAALCTELRGVAVARSAAHRAVPERRAPLRQAGARPAGPCLAGPRCPVARAGRPRGLRAGPCRAGPCPPCWSPLTRFSIPRAVAGVA